MKALFLESLPYRSAFRVGSHAYASRFVAAGWDAMWLSHPLSPPHFMHPVKRDWTERVEGWRHGPLGRDGLRYYSPLTLLPTGRQPVLRSRFVARRSVLATSPSLVTVLRRESFRGPDLVWLTNPVYEPLLARLESGCVAVRVADDHTRFRNVPESIAELEERALARADVVFAVASGVHDRLARRFENVVWLPNGVDFEHFSSARDEPDDLAMLPHPRVLYVGALEYWFDEAAVAQAANSLPEASFVVIGPANRDLSILTSAPNVHLLGPRPYERLPGYLQHCDAAIVPFARDEMVDSIHPIKVYEYLAAGLPVVASRWAELERMQAPVTLVDPGEMPDALSDVLSRAAAEGRTERMGYARSNSWGERFITARLEVERILAGGGAR
jgi:glycosyltransferase involved in cell wall biosynthesis